MILYTIHMNSSSNFPIKSDFYRHYKHDPSRHPHDHTYEIMGIGRGTEDELFYVMYRPVYPNDWLPPADVQLREVGMFMETVEKNGQNIPRFAQITDPALIAELVQARDAMFPPSK